MLQYFDKDLFFYNLDLGGHSEVLQFINEKLLAKDIVTKDHLGSVFKREELCPTAFFNRFALPHSLEAEGLKKKVAYYYSENPIEWYGSKVNLVIMFVTTKYDEEFSTVFDLIFEVLLDNNLYHQLTSCDVFEKVIDFLSEEF